MLLAVNLDGISLDAPPVGYVFLPGLTASDLDFVSRLREYDDDYQPVPVPWATYE